MARLAILCFNFSMLEASIQKTALNFCRFVRANSIASWVFPIPPNPWSTHIFRRVGPAELGSIDSASFAISVSRATNLFNTGTPFRLNFTQNEFVLGAMAEAVGKLT